VSCALLWSLNQWLSEWDGFRPWNPSNGPLPSRNGADCRVGM